jgi:hypothetical protein
MTPTKRTLRRLRDLGWLAEVVEKWNSYSRTSKDLFGCIDILAMHPDRHGLVGIQCTSRSNHSARKKKAMALPQLRLWLQTGYEFAVWSWGKVGPRGKRKLWDVRVEGILLSQLEDKVDASADP